MDRQIKGLEDQMQNYGACLFIYICDETWRFVDSMLIILIPFRYLFLPWFVKHY